MTVGALSTAPVLSTPDVNILDGRHEINSNKIESTLTDEQLWSHYEIQRTVDEVFEKGWRRVALQFPDDLLVDAPRVYTALSNILRTDSSTYNTSNTSENRQECAEKSEESLGELTAKVDAANKAEARQVFILGDTSYGACCVDEIAAEHVNADVVIHYGRSCLSPSEKLPVIYVFTRRGLDLDAAVEAFKDAYPEHDVKVLIMADTPYSHHIPDLVQKLKSLGYSNINLTEIIHDPNSWIPNRSLPSSINSKDDLKQYHLFHVSEPPGSLLLTLSSRVKSFRIFPCNVRSDHSKKSILSSTEAKLRRRYALVTNLSSCSVFGILINTLSVKNFLHVTDHVKRILTRAGKKAYSFVVGKINPAKVANFSEIEGWVVIGCWESSLIESKEFWKPIITPFELELALQDDSSRVWTGEWTSDFQAVLQDTDHTSIRGHARLNDYSSEDDSRLPQFSLRTGKFVLPAWEANLQTSTKADDLDGSKGNNDNHSSLVKKANGSVVRIGGEISPGAAFLRDSRTWQGLGSDFKISYEDNDNDNKPSLNIQEGRRGIAKGYVGESLKASDQTLS